jgi:fibronectin-binding autotransporter adhesin
MLPSHTKYAEPDGRLNVRTFGQQIRRHEGRPSTSGREQPSSRLHRQWRVYASSALLTIVLEATATTNARAQALIAIDTTLTASSGSIWTGEPAAWAYGMGTIDTLGPVSFLSNGVGPAVFAQDGGSIALMHGASIATTGGGIGLLVTGANSRLVGNGIVALTSGQGWTETGQPTYGAWVGDGGLLDLTAGSIGTQDRDAIALYAAPEGSIVGSGIAVATSGQGAHGAVAHGNIHLTGGSVTTTGGSAIGLLSSATGATLTAIGTAVSTSGYNANGADSVTGDMTLTDVSITTSGEKSYGVKAEYNAATITRSHVTTSGFAAIGLVSVADAVLVADDVTIVTSGTTGHGATAQYGGKLLINGGSINTSGQSANGLFAAVVANGVGASIVANDVTVTTAGVDAYGARVLGGSNLTIRGGSTITTTGPGASALAAMAYYDLGDSTITVEQSTLNAALATGILTDGTTLSATIVGSSLSGGTGILKTINNGILNLAVTSSTLNGIALTDETSKTNLTLRDSRWISAGGSLTNLTLESGSHVSLTKAIALTQKLQLSRGTSLSLAATGSASLIKAAAVEIGSGVSLNIAGIETIGQGQRVLIDADTGIAGDFATVTVGGYAGAVDYLTLHTRKSADGTKYVASGGLSWTANNNLAHGTFTLSNADNAFTVAAALGDRAANPTTTWNGRALTKAGPGTLVLTGANTYTGETRVEAGMLAIETGGSIASSILLSVADGARLSGTGTVGATVIAAGGTIAPGHSIGTLTVAGNLTMAPGSIYQAEIASDGSADRIAVTGSATVAGAHVVVSALDPGTTYKTGQRFRIVTATAGVSGAFADAVSQSAFLLVALDHSDPNAVDLTISLGNTPGGWPGMPGQPDGALFNTAAETPNQRAVAGTLDSLAQRGPSLGLYNGLLMLNASGARAAFDGLSGEIHASVRGALIEDSRFVREAATDRLRATFGAVGAAKVPVMAYDAEGPVTAAATTDRLSFWGQGLGSWGRGERDGNAATLARSSGGALAGADIPVFEYGRFGLIAGYSRTNFEAAQRNSSGESDNYHLGIYAGTQTGRFGVRAGLAHSWHQIWTRRAVAFPGFGDQLSARSRAGTDQAFGELGYRIDSESTAFEPFAGLAYVALVSDGLRETGGAGTLRAVRQANQTGFATLGLRASTSFALGNFKATARGALAWRHAFGEISPLFTQSFASGNAFTIAGLPIARDSALVEAGLDLAISPAATLGLAYSGHVATTARQSAFKANLGIRF